MRGIRKITLSSCRRVTWSMVLATALLAAACTARKTYQEPNLGWHSANFGTVFGRLQRVPGPTADAKPYWVIRFGRPDEMYQGELALTPEGPMVGRSEEHTSELQSRGLISY